MDIRDGNVSELADDAGIGDGEESFRLFLTGAPEWNQVGWRIG